MDYMDIETNVEKFRKLFWENYPRPEEEEKKEDDDKMVKCVRCKQYFPKFKTKRVEYAVGVTRKMTSVRRCFDCYEKLIEYRSKIKF